MADRPPQGNYGIVRVLYGTNRKRTGSSDPLEFYGKERTNGLELGAVYVSIPTNHQTAVLETHKIWKGEFHNVPEKHVTLLRVKTMSGDQFKREMQNQLDRSTRKEAIVFIHGYNVTFEDAARRSAQITYDLEFDGPSVLYSWPSIGTTALYTHDRQNAQVSGFVFAEFLQKYINDCGAESIHLVAHSMGNLVMSVALHELNRDPQFPAKLYNEIVMAAADIDIDEFLRLKGSVCRSGKRVTVYASSNDRALMASKQVNGAQRLGDTNPAVFVTDGLEMLDVSVLDTSVLGHSYIGSSTSIVGDLKELLSTHNGPDIRCCYERKNQETNSFWVFKN